MPRRLLRGRASPHPKPGNLPCHAAFPLQTLMEQDMAAPVPPTTKPLKTEEDRLEAALEDSFPASDPPSMTAPSRHIGKPAKKKSDPDKS
jgi:hypothetical protein